MATVAATIAVAFLVVGLIKLLLEYVKQVKLCKKYPMPSLPLPLVGHCHLFYNINREDILDTVLTLAKVDTNQRKVMIFLGNQRLIWYFHPEPVEEILSSNEIISKSNEYIYLQPWLGTGLLLSTHQKWRVRRKLLTPAFHFRILEDALDVFNAQGQILADVLLEDSLKKSDNILDIFNYITRCTLDIILETAMGQAMGIQLARESTYCDTINSMVHVMQQRQIQPQYQFEAIFAMSSMKKDYDQALATLHEFTKRVIREKRAEVVEVDSAIPIEKDSAPAPKGRVAFLDLLLKAVLPDGSKLNDDDIQEEVDTFMFEGHDTTACALSWSLFLLGKNPEIMEKVIEEQKEIFQDNYLAEVTQNDLAKMKYLECCVKEALRLYPSVPIIGRNVEKDCIIDGQKVAKGTSAIVLVHLLHRNSSIWERPEEFIPERFLETTKRHPYAYVPFSAGPRNCIGQRFALMEEKTVLSHVLRRLNFESMDRNIKPVVEIITRPFGGVRSKITKREED